MGPYRWRREAHLKPTLTTFSFVSADDRLLKVAQAVGLSTDNPNHHS